MRSKTTHKATSKPKLRRYFTGYFLGKAEMHICNEKAKQYRKEKKTKASQKVRARTLCIYLKKALRKERVLHRPLPGTALRLQMFFQIFLYSERVLYLPCKQVRFHWKLFTLASVSSLIRNALQSSSFDHFC